MDRTDVNSPKRMVRLFLIFFLETSLLALGPMIYGSIHTVVVRYANRKLGGREDGTTGGLFNYRVWSLAFGVSFLFILTNWRY